MIFSLFITPITWILTFLFGLFPVLAIDTNVASSLASAGHSLYSLNAFIPINTFGMVVGLYIAVEIAILVFQFLRFCIGFIPFIGGK